MILTSTVSLADRNAMLCERGMFSIDFESFCGRLFILQLLQWIQREKALTGNALVGFRFLETLSRKFLTQTPKCQSGQRQAEVTKSNIEIPGNQKQINDDQ